MKIFCCFIYLNIDKCVKYLKDKGISCGHVKFSDLLFVNVPFTPEEILNYDINHRIGYEGHRNLYGEYPMNTQLNFNYNSDCISKINDTISSDRYEYIFITFDTYIVNYLRSENYDITFFYPEYELKYDYVRYRTRSLDVNETKMEVKVISNIWDTHFKRFEECDSDKKVKLSKDVYLEDIIDEYL